MADDRADLHWGRTGAYDGRVLAPWLMVAALLLWAAVANFLARP